MCIRDRGKGPDLDTPLGDASFDYNGVDPTRGRNFRWYRKAVFQDQLRRFGWTAVKRRTGVQVYESVAERQCLAGDERRFGAVFAGHRPPGAAPWPAVLPASAGGSALSRERAEGDARRRGGADGASGTRPDAMLVAV